MKQSAIRFKIWDRALNTAEAENESFIGDTFQQCEDAIKSYLDNGIMRMPVHFVGANHFYCDPETGNASITGWIKDNFTKCRHVALTRLSNGVTLEYLDGELYYNSKSLERM